MKMYVPTNYRVVANPFRWAPLKYRSRRRQEAHLLLTLHEPPLLNSKPMPNNEKTVKSQFRCGLVHFGLLWFTVPGSEIPMKPRKNSIRV